MLIGLGYTISNINNININNTGGVMATSTIFGADILYEETLSEVGSFDAVTIPAGYSTIQIDAFGRTNNDATYDVFVLALNEDTTDSNYEHWCHISGDAHTIDTIDNVRVIGIMAGATGQTPTQYYSPLTALIHQPNNTSAYKVAIAQSNERQTTGGNVYRHRIDNLIWKNTASITKIHIGSLGSFLAGSYLRILGLKAMEVQTP
jgi:hypothetical protein